MTAFKPKGTDEEWLNPWLRWLDDVERLSGRRDFGPGDTLDLLHDQWKAGRTPEQACDWLNDQ